MTTLQELYEEYDGKTVSYRIIVAGADITNRVSSFDWQFSGVGQVPTASFNVPSGLMVSAIAEEAEVEIWFGYKIGFIDLRKLVFGGGVIDSVSYSSGEFNVECIQDGARRLNYPYYKQIDYDFDNVTAQEAATALLDLAGVPVYVVELDPWLIGTAVPQVLKFSNYGDAINKVATVDGTEWFALPSGQIRVEKRDPLPYDNPKRTYYSSNLVGIAESQPTGVDPVNPLARPRIDNLNKNYDRPGVNNFINVDGATLVTLGPNGEQNSEQIHEEVDAAPGVFDNGAPWITTPPLFQPFTYSNELIDTNAKANSVANRYLLLKNRLAQSLSVRIPLDPELFLCMTIKIIDEVSNTSDLYFLESYRCSVSDGNVTSDLMLRGGPYSGTQGFASPFAEFRWTYEALWNRTQGNNEIGSTGCGDNAASLNAGFATNLGSKLCQDIPENVGSTQKGGNKPTAQQGMVFIGFDGTLSEDFDGNIVSWAWSDSQGHTATGSRVTFIYDPTVASSIQMTLTVTDDTARTDVITKTVYVGATAPPIPLLDDPTLNDTPEGGGAAAGDCTEGGDPEHGQEGEPGGDNGMALMYFVAAECKAMASADNETWNMLDKDNLGVGNFISVDAKTDYENGITTALFGTEEGEIVKTQDGAQTGEVTHSTGDNTERIESIAFDDRYCSNVFAVTSKGQILKSENDGDSWSVHKPKDGIEINKIMFHNGTMYIFGGDTADPSSLVRLSYDEGKTFHSMVFPNNLQFAISQAGPGNTVKTAAINQERLMIGFDGGVSPPVWTSPDSNTWTPAQGMSGTNVRTAAPGFGDSFAVSTEDGVENTSDGENFTPGCSTPQNDLYWEGIPGVYIAVNDGAITKIIDDTCGDMMPNAGFPAQTDMPVCARPLQTKVLVAPRPTEGSGIWPLIVSPDDFITYSFRGGISAGSGPINGIFTVPDNGGNQILLMRLQIDEAGSFLATDDLSWSNIGQGDEVKVEYCLVSGNGQTISWSMNSGPSDQIQYSVVAIIPSTGLISVTAVDFDQITGDTGNNLIVANSDKVFSHHFVGWNNQPPGAISRQPPLEAVSGGNFAVSQREGEGTAPWAGAGATGVWYLAALGLNI